MQVTIVLCSYYHLRVQQIVCNKWCKTECKLKNSIRVAGSETYLTTELYRTRLQLSRIILTVVYAHKITSGINVKRIPKLRITRTSLFLTLLLLMSFGWFKIVASSYFLALIFSFIIPRIVPLPQSASMFSLFVCLNLYSVAVVLVIVEALMPHFAFQNDAVKLYTSPLKLCPEIYP